MMSSIVSMGLPKILILIVISWIHSHRKTAAYNEEQKQAELCINGKKSTEFEKHEGPWRNGSQ